MSNDNGNGDRSRPSVGPTPLDLVRKRIEARQAEEAAAGLMSVEESSPLSDEDDPLHAWKKRMEGSPITLELLHEGLISLSQFSEAAIEGGIKLAADVNRALPHVQRNADHIKVISAKIETLASKVESISTHIHQVDEELAAVHKTLGFVRKDVQFLKDDIREIKEIVQQIPAIKDLLGEILVRLPEPKVRPTG